MEGSPLQRRESGLRVTELLLKIIAGAVRVPALRRARYSRLIYSYSRRDRTAGMYVPSGRARALVTPR